jgi:hypothetical protein
MDELWRAYIELERIEPDMEKTWENLVIWELGMVKQRCFHLPKKLILDDVQLTGENVLEDANYKLVTRHPGIWLSTQLVLVFKFGTTISSNNGI